MAEDGGEKPLKKISEAFKDLAITLNSEDSDLKVAPFSHACSLVSPLFGCLGLAFKFAEMDYVAKVSRFSHPLFFLDPQSLSIAVFCIFFKYFKCSWWS